LKAVEGFSIHSKVFTFSDGHDLDDNRLFNNAIDDTDGLLRRIELVVTGEVETRSVAEMFAESGAV
jgi:hypothetical protein